MALVVEMEGDALSLSGDIQDVGDYSCISRTRSRLESFIGLSSGKALQVNLSQLAAVSSVVLSLLLCAVREANKVSCEIKFVNMSQGLFDMARVGGIESLFPRLNR